MKVKFLGATEAEDRIVEIPEGTDTVEVELPKTEIQRSPWPSVVFIIAVMAWTLALVLVFRG